MLQDPPGLHAAAVASVTDDYNFQSSPPAFVVTQDSKSQEGGGDWLCISHVVWGWRESRSVSFDYCNGNWALCLTRLLVITR